jgi:hypothetical protein
MAVIKALEASTSSYRLRDPRLVDNDAKNGCQLEPSVGQGTWSRTI